MQCFAMVCCRFNKALHYLDITMTCRNGVVPVGPYACGQAECTDRKKYHLFFQTFMFIPEFSAMISCCHASSWYWKSQFKVVAHHPVWTKLQVLS